MPAAYLHILLAATPLAGQAFFSGLWQGAALFLAAALFLRLVPRITPSARFLIWTSAFTLAAALPLVHTRRLNLGAASGSAVVHIAPAWGLCITALWVALTATRLGQLIVQAVQLGGIWRRAVPVPVDPEVAALLRCTRRHARLCISADVDTPSVIGFFAPRLLIPAALVAQLSEEDLRQIVLHECGHLTRYDDWINFAQKLALALFPLNPALFWVDRRLGLERELACDATVIARTEAPLQYARTLTRLAEHRLHSRRVALALSAWASGSRLRHSELARRIQRLVHPVRFLSAPQTTVALALVTFALCAGAVQMLRAPRLIAFSALPSGSGHTPVPTVALNAGPLASAAATLNAGPPASAAALPVMYRSERPAHETLLTAMVPSTRSTGSARLRTATGQRGPGSTLPMAVQHIASSSSIRPRAYLTRSTHLPRRVPLLARAPYADEPDAPRPVLLLSNGLSPSYAAVPLGDGWLIVQL